MRVSRPLQTGRQAASTSDIPIEPESLELITKLVAMRCEIALIRFDRAME